MINSVKVQNRTLPDLHLDVASYSHLPPASRSSVFPILDSLDARRLPLVPAPTIMNFGGGCIIVLGEPKSGFAFAFRLSPSRQLINS